MSLLSDLEYLQLECKLEEDEDIPALGVVSLASHVSCFTRLATLSLVNQPYLDELPVELFDTQRCRCDKLFVMPLCTLQSVCLVLHTN